MAIHSPEVLPAAVEIDKALLLPAVAAPAPPQQVDAEQARAVETLFAKKDQESDQVLGLLGMWTGTLLLHDLAVEHFSQPVDELELATPKPREPDPEDDPEPAA